MKWFCLLCLLAVSFVQALPDAGKKNGDGLVVRARSKTDLASEGRKAGEGTHIRKRRDAEEPEEPEKPEKPKKKGLMDLNVDIDIKGPVGKAIIDIDIDAGNGEGEKSGGPESENGGEKQPAPNSGQDPCECVGSLKAQSLKLDAALDSLISAMESLEEAASANKDPGLPRVSSTALAVVESLKGDVNKTVKSIAKYMRYYCLYIYYYYSGWVYRCYYVIYYRKRRDVGNEMDPTGPTGMEPTGPTSMGPETPVGMKPAGPPGMGGEGPPGMGGEGPPGMGAEGPPGMGGEGPPGMGAGGPPGMGPMPAGETGSPLCMAGDMAGILEDIAEEIKKGMALTEQAVNDGTISADAVSGIGEIIDALEEHKKTNKDVMKELDGLPCKD